MKKGKEPMRPERPDDEDPIEAKPIKVYPFDIDELSEENGRGWFQEMYT